MIHLQSRARYTQLSMNNELLDNNFELQIGTNLQSMHLLYG